MKSLIIFSTLLFSFTVQAATPLLNCYLSGTADTMVRLERDGDKIIMTETQKWDRKVKSEVPEQQWLDKKIMLNVKEKSEVSYLHMDQGQWAGQWFYYQAGLGFKSIGAADCRSSN